MALDFDATLNSDEFRKGLNNVLKQIEDLDKKARESSVGLEQLLSIDNLDGYIKGLEGLSNEQQDTFRRLIESAKDTKEFMKDIADPTSLGVYNKQLEDTEKKLNDLIRVGKAQAQQEALFQRVLPENIEAQAEFIKVLKNDLKELKAIDGIDAQQVAELERELKLAEVALERMKQALGGNEEATRSVVSRQTELRREMQLLYENNQQHTEQYKALSREVEKLQAVREDVRAQQRGEHLGVKTLTEALGTLAGAYSVVTGVTSMFIDNEQKLQEIQTKLQSAMAISIGVQQLQQNLRRSSLVMGRVELVQEMARKRATDLSTASTIRATIAQRALNLVANANPYVLLATAVLSLVGAFALYSRGVNSAVRRQKEMNKAIADNLGNVAKERVELMLTRDAIEDRNNSESERLRLVKELQSTYPNIFANLSKEEILAGNVGDAYERVNKAIYQRAQVEAISELLAKKAEESLKRELKLTQELEDVRTKKAQLDAKYGENKIKEVQVMANAYDAEIERLQNNIGKLESTFEEENKIFLDKLRELRSGMEGVFDGDSSLEIVVEGSVKYYQDMITQLQNALANTPETAVQVIASINAKIEEYQKRISNIQSKGEKKTTETITQEVQSRIKLWEDYYNAVALLGRETADRLYKDSLDTNSSLLNELENNLSVLLELDKPTQEQLTLINTLKEQIRSLQGLKSPLEEIKAEVESNIESMSIYSNRIEYLQEVLDGLGDTPMDLELKAFISDKIDSTTEERQKVLDALLESEKTYDEKRREIEEKYQVFLDDINTSQLKKEKLRNKKSLELLEITFEELRDNPMYEQAFVNMQSVATKYLEELRSVMVQKLKEAESEADKIKLGEFIKELDNVIASRKPFSKLKALIKAVGDEALDAQQKLALLGEAGAELTGYANAIGGIVADVEGIADDLGLSLDNSFGDILDKIGGVVEGIGQIGEGMQMIAQGDPISVIAGSIKVLGGVVKSVSAIFNNDRKRERQVKRILDDIEKMKSAYQDLEHAIQRALGSEVFSLHIEQIDNLKQQQAKLYEAIAKEEKKKKKSKSRIREWEEEIKEIDRTIDNIVDTIQEKLMGTNVQGFADNLASALVNAFRAGEDAANSLNRTVDDMFANIIQNFIAMRMAPELEKIFDKITEQLFNAFSETQPTPPITAEGWEQYLEDLWDWYELQRTMGMSKEDADRFRAEAEAITSQWDAVLDNLFDIFGISLDTADLKGMQGAIQGITEQTAGVLEGQINVIRMDTSTLVLIAQRNEGSISQGLLYLGGIKQDTSNLPYIRNELVELNRKIDGNNGRNLGI